MVRQEVCFYQIYQVCVATTRHKGCAHTLYRIDIRVCDDTGSSIGSITGPSKTDSDIKLSIS